MSYQFVPKVDLLPPSYQDSMLIERGEWTSVRLYVVCTKCYRVRLSVCPVNHSKRQEDEEVGEKR